MSRHLSTEDLARLLDDELTGGLTACAESHLAGCVSCRQRFSELRQVSVKFDSFFASLHPAFSDGERQQLAQKLDKAETKIQKAEKRWNWSRLGWSTALAATAALGVFLLPHGKVAKPVTLVAAHGLQIASSAFEVDGETFVALPYSNPDLPLAAPHIVQMQVPVSSLADAGIYLEPVGSRMATPDRAVLANVLLGLDGQPLGVHVLTSD